MGKGRKNHKPQPAPAPAPTQPASPIAASPAPTASGNSARRIGLQIAAILGLSAALGFTFNAANPIGVRFGDSTARSAALNGAPTNFNLISTSSIVAATKAAPPPAPLPPPRLEQRVPIQRPTNSQAHVPTPPGVAATNPPAPVAPAVGETPATPAFITPDTIHWRDAKPLVAAGQAVLVDVRPKAVFDAGHIPDAISLPETSTPEEFTAFTKQYPTNTTLIVYCASTSCSQSRRVAFRLAQAFNYGSVTYMTGGYLEYQQEELANPQSRRLP